jgi:threonyl-tRNA synthetase
MISIQLPDGSRREFPGPVTVEEVAASIGPGLAKAALGGRIGEGKASRVVDTSFRIEHDEKLAIVTDKDPDGLELIRHSTAHLLAYAVKELFPDAQVTIGPVIENGFYYDFAYKRPFTPEDLAAIEAKMAELAKKDEPVTRRVLPRDEAVAHFNAMGEAYKAEIIGSIPAGEDVSLYREGAFEDLCRGPHVPRTGKLRHFKLMKVAGAYWRGDSKNEMLQRIYGTAWATKDELQQYLHMLEEAEKRDHRKLGRELDLFHIDEVAPGVVFWHPEGLGALAGDRALHAPGLSRHRLSGGQGPAAPRQEPVGEDGPLAELPREHVHDRVGEARVRAQADELPGHVLIFKSHLRSYKELPIRYGEFGQCHRNEPSGALHGIMRIRGFTQDDGHVFCTEDQILDECVAYTEQLQKVYRDFGFTDIIYKVATRPDSRVGADDLWDKAEYALQEALRRSGCQFVIAPGDGAFYGPKIEYTLKDALGRQWQLGTMQVDFNTAERLGGDYVTETSGRAFPVMLHRAIVGSFERFIGILLEHHAGAMPAWLAPIQASVLNISENSADYAREVAKTLQKQGLRVESDLRNEKITYKIREHSLQKVPYILVVGDKEKASGAVSVRARGNHDLGAMPLGDFTAKLVDDIARKA